MKFSMKLLLAVSTALSLCGCSSSVKTDQTKLGDIKIRNHDPVPASGVAQNSETMKDGVFSPKVASPEASAAGSQVEFDMAAEGEISKQCLEAWRKAVKGDEKGSLSQLNELEKRYPKYSTIKFMKGQVLEHLGKREDAIKFYRESLDNSEFSSIRQFKLAEALRKTNKFADAEPLYRKILKSFDDFKEAKLGLAHCLIGQKKDSKEGAQLLQETVILCEALVKTQNPGKVAEGKRVLKEVLLVDPANADAKRILGSK